MRSEGIFIGKNVLNGDDQSRDDFFDGVVRFLKEELPHINVTHVKTGVVPQGYIKIKITNGSMHTNDIDVFIERYPDTYLDFTNNILEVALIQDPTRNNGRKKISVSNGSEKTKDLAADVIKMLFYLFFIYQLSINIFF